jgi:hypothetical protein
MTKYNEAPDTSNRKSTLPSLPSLQEPLPVIGADKAASKPKPRQRPPKPPQRPASQSLRWD